MPTYHISFDTNVPAPGYVTSTKIVISKYTTKDTGEKFSIALWDDPLYKDLVAYVKNNPPLDKG